MKRIFLPSESAAPPRGSSSRDEAGTSTWRIASLSVIVLSLLCGAYVQNEVLLGPDVGWLIRSVRLMFDGQRFGVDIFEPNLPVAWYLCMPAAWGVEFFGLTEVTAIRLWIWIIAGVSLLVTRGCIVHSTDRSYRVLAELSAAAVAGCILVGPSFGQREHLAFLLSLPYLFVVWLRSSGVPAESRYAIIAGVFAGIAFSIKPIFLAVPLAIEFSMLALWRRHWKLIRPETLAIALAGGVSFCGAIALSPDYVKYVVPVTYATYWAYDNPLGYLLAAYPVATVVFLGWLVASLADFRIARSSMVWLAAFSAWTASYFMQRKGFDYHGYPATACALVLSIGMLTVLASKLRRTTDGLPTERKDSWERPKIVGAAAMILITSLSLVSETRLWFRGSQENWPFSRVVARKELIMFLDSLGVGRGKSVFVFSTNPFPAFPTLNYVGADWVGPDMAQFLLPAWIRKGEMRDADARQAIDAAMVVQRQHVSRALLGGKPDFILVNSGSRSGSRLGGGTRRIDYFAIFGTDPALAVALDRYSKVAELRGVQLYVRTD